MTLRLIAPMSGHMDEYNYLFVGKLLLDGQDWPTLTYIFGADFNWYPFAFAETWIGGLNGARLISLTLGFLSLVTSWFICHRLWGCKRTALIASLLISVSASHLFISRHVSYDIISYFLFTLSLYPLLRCSQQNRYQLLWLSLGITLYIAAVFSKYILVIYAPFICLVLMLLAPRMAIVGAVIFSIAMALYGWQFQDELRILYQNQVLAVHDANATLVDLLKLATGFLLIPISLCAIAATFAMDKALPRSSSERFIIITCVVMAMPLLTYHLIGENKISLYKHLVYSVFFLSFPAAWALNNLIDSAKNVYHTSHVLPITALALTIHSTLQLQTLREGYPDIRDMLSVAVPVLGQSANILSEDPYLFRYVQFGKSDQVSISETGWLDYNQDGRYESSDVEMALKDRHFEIVFLNDQIDPESNHRYRQLLRDGHYQTLYSEPYMLSPNMTNNRSGHISLYQRQAMPKITPLTDATAD